MFTIFAHQKTQKYIYSQKTQKNAFSRKLERERKLRETIFSFSLWVDRQDSNSCAAVRPEVNMRRMDWAEGTGVCMADKR